MVIIKGCKIDLIEEIVSKLGSFTILDINYYPYADLDELICDIEIATKRTVIMFNNNDLVLQRIDLDKIRFLHINPSRFREVIIQ